MSTSQAIKSKNVGYTHFVSLPLTLPDEMVTKLNNFKNSLLQTNKGLGIDKSIFIKPNTLHLTVQMLKLSNTSRIKVAADVLRRVSPKVMDALEQRPVYIRLKGLVILYSSYAIIGFCKFVTLKQTKGKCVLEPPTMPLVAMLTNLELRKAIEHND